MKKIVFLSAWLFTFTASSHAQTWFQKAIGGSGNDYANCILQTKDKGFVLCGRTDTAISKTTGSLYIVKTDNVGNIQWSRGYDSVYEAYSIVETLDGGFALTTSYNKLSILKLDNTGNIQWFKYLVAGTASWGLSLVQTTDSGYAICGYISMVLPGGSDPCVVKVDKNGNLQWTTIMTSTNIGQAKSIIQTTDGGLAVCGRSSYDMYAFKLSAGGALQWATRMGSPADDAGYSIVQAADGGYGLCGYSSFQGQQHMYVARLDAIGNVQWDKVIQLDSMIDYDYAYGIANSPSGGFTICGSHLLASTSQQTLVVAQLDNLGNLNWARSMQSNTNGNPRSIVSTADGGYAIAGSTSFVPSSGFTDMLFMKMPGDGNICNSTTMPAVVKNGGGMLFSGGNTTTIGTLINGNTGNPYTGGVVNTFCSTLANVGTVAEPTPYIYPNPARDRLTISMDRPLKNTVVDLYNAYGQKVREYKSLSGVKNSLQINELASGIYYIVIMENNMILTRDKLFVDQ